jgi:hypothetical protein
MTTPAPHVRHPAARLRGLCANPDVAVTVDTETFPPEVLTIRGRVAISEFDGIPPEYASAARRYLGEEGARQYLSGIDQPGTRMARIDLRPAWVGVHAALKVTRLGKTEDARLMVQVPR